MVSYREIAGGVDAAVPDVSGPGVRAEVLGALAAERATNDDEEQGPQKDGQPARRLLAAVVTREKRVWFFKLLGPADLVGKEKPAYEALLNSVRFPRP